jgi:hypothetical protein
MQDAHDQEASRTMIKGKSSKKGSSEMDGLAFVSKGAANRPIGWIGEQ